MRGAYLPVVTPVALLWHGELKASELETFLVYTYTTTAPGQFMAFALDHHWI